ncbi:PREDICTED: RNA-binding protein 48 isoform X2 [Nicotiana attenuata]|uniref:RNA-binding protein 48 isoform X2 n=1 Tax=Nicotiana attenuata TaxID=49451 RepID=UPI0009051EA3|nr:PREDICTED: RNA-binding protein 48 isoform X2 [Nicotiana attenuata]
MPRYKDEPPAVCVYTICDESKYLIVRNVPALGCGDQLSKLFSTYGEIEEFSKRKLDESVFLGNRLQVSYAPQFESLHETKEKLEARRKEVLARLTPGRSKGSATYRPDVVGEPSPASSPAQLNSIAQSVGANQRQSSNLQYNSTHGIQGSPVTMVSSDKEYFPSQSMNQTVKLVREKLNKIQSSVDHLEGEPSKRKRVDNRRRI